MCLECKWNRSLLLSIAWNPTSTGMPLNLDQYCPFLSVEFRRRYGFDAICARWKRNIASILARRSKPCPAIEAIAEMAKSRQVVILLTAVRPMNPGDQREPGIFEPRNHLPKIISYAGLNK